ncbi:ABC transporter substrate-binding protein [Actinomadura sp. NBRC 104412]|uniref:ABC transporter substrate-binding protein n=1 Tax=Actinomadura sp. NBRC 104412 TaxID=3032203 RepID=UPI0024A5825C|nr:ABC transporter substrate-binding protein [Actinomadura sp. NBRC 104412]GLZ08878.1 ABC transporter substrate-binding protein [Actinomadura sp. NBRC 104412]
MPRPPWLAALIAALVAAPVAACSLGADVPMDGTGPIYFADGHDTSRGSQIKRLVAEWNRRHPGERVEHIELAESTTDVRAQMMTHAQDAASVDASAALGPVCYDVITVDVVWTAEFARWGHILPLDEDDVDHDEFLRKPIDSGRYGGRLYAVPLRADVGLLYYRKDALGTAPVPRTWEQLRNQARTIAPAHNLQGYVTQLDRYEGFTVNVMESIWDTGGTILGADGEVTGSREGIARGFGRLVQGIRERWIPAKTTDFNEEATRGEFQDGRALFMRNWTYAYELLSAENSYVANKFDVARLPTPSALGGWNLAISKCSQHRATALRFLRYLSSEESERVLFTGAGFAPSRKALYEDPALQSAHPHLRIIRDAIEDSRNRGPSPYYHRVSGVFQSNLHDALIRPTDLGPRLDDLTTELHHAAEGR